jgi:hypothetical protein
MAHENVTVPAKSLVLATLEPVYIISPALQRFGSNVCGGSHAWHFAMPPIVVEDDDRDAIEFDEPDPGDSGFHSISHDAVPRPCGDSFAFNPPIQRMLAQPVEPVLETPPCRASTGVFSPLGMEAGVLTPKNVST